MVTTALRRKRAAIQPRAVRIIPTVESEQDQANDLSILILILKRDRDPNVQEDVRKGARIDQSQEAVMQAQLALDRSLYSLWNFANTSWGRLFDELVQLLPVAWPTFFFFEHFGFFITHTCSFICRSDHLLRRRCTQRRDYLWICFGELGSRKVFVQLWNLYLCKLIFIFVSNVAASCDSSNVSKKHIKSFMLKISGYT